MKLYVYYLPAFFLAFILAAVATAILIPRLKAMKMGQKILTIGPVWHAKKEGTPTMGGMAFLLATLLGGGIMLVFSYQAIPVQEWTLLPIALLFCIVNGAVGTVDDLTKLRHHRNEGLTPTQKLILQTTFAAAFLALLRMAGILESKLALSVLGELPLGFATYFVLMILILGTVNCANLTDGIDGLATAVAAVIFAFYTLYAAKQEAFAPTVLSALLFGCALAFFFFNRHPAKIFMGDTGSLFFGAGAVAVPLLLKNHLLALITGIVYVLEGVSVILQVVYYKATKKRLFLMAPIHHHLEKCGFSENKIVALFVSLTVLACLIAFFLL